VAEHDSDIRLPETIGRCAVERVATYGETTVTLYAHELEKDDQAEQTASEGDASIS
jgi:hypothetical protein